MISNTLNIKLSNLLATNCQKNHKIKSHTELWEFYVDRYYRCLFTKKANKYLLKWVGTHNTIDRM